MASSDPARTRAPRGAKAVVSAFMTALDGIPDARRAEVAKAAQLAIRDEVKTMTVKAKAASKAAGKPAARKPAAAKKAAPAAKAAPVRRAKRSAAAPAAA